jgi:hypothetical protein
LNRDANLDPLFRVNVEFIEQEMPEIPNEFIHITKVNKFVPPPLGFSKKEDFDPVVHLEIEDPEEEEE